MEKYESMEECEKMEKYLENIYGDAVKVQSWDGIRKLPLYLRNKRTYYTVCINDQKLLAMKNNSGEFHVSHLKNELDEMVEYSHLPAVLWLDTVSTYQRNALVKSRISFIIPNSQMYVPELGISFREKSAEKKETKEKLSATAQLLLLYFIYHDNQEGYLQAEIANQLGASAMNMSRAVSELKGLELVEVYKAGASNLLKPNGKGLELYRKAESYMQSPVQRSIYVKQTKEINPNIKLFLAGESALAKNSMLNEPLIQIYAMDKKEVKMIPEAVRINPRLILEQDYIEIQLWKYNPAILAKDGVVDVLSMVMSLKKETDERIEMQIEKVLEEYIW